MNRRDKRECACCGAGNPSFGFGCKRDGRHDYWLCGTCWIQTPAGQAQAAVSSRRLATDEESDD